MARDDAKKWLQKKEAVWSKFNGKCAYCGCDISINKFQIDHIIAKGIYDRNIRYYQDQGLKIDSIENLNPACCSCNNYKRDFTVDQFRSEIEQQIERLRRDKPTFRNVRKVWINPLYSKEG